ncbi:MULTISPECIES: glycosyltransferase family 4 protein [Thermomonospora]|uniref:Glycosyl transferase group 1 n=1 Tax=Thermomonospora curvata (strain ATCC 19995 / DSM 43183 / JCM 3096 / KCTC 9072 / NBRC 15933 / NCIMB 10081 / Henssen B9) TaxID=471852 RepID=D1A2B4_THECD|nr:MULTISPECIES: glycosyltransferase family 4 protein [Thermomonospora]ACY99767.1 glycosyl transferase group 1 [Thermomonospora curvata DSM 43183]PKK12772.1 MAG: glycosyltransferase family 4 protein [Thermomonospora sp. CIF 1]
MKITYVLMHAYGMGGTIRTVINQAAAMAEAGHEVQIASVIRRRGRPQFPIDPRVRLITLDDQRGANAPPRPPRPSRTGRLLERLERRLGRRLRRPRPVPVPPGWEPGPEVPAGEAAKEVFTRRVEERVIEFLQSLQEGVVVTTRPGLNLLSARYAPPHLVRIAQDHMHLDRYKPDVREAIASDYPRLDAVVSLTRRDEAAYRRALGGRVRTAQIPNPLHTLQVPRTDHSAKVVAAAGRLTRQKGFDLLIEAFAQVVRRHPDWTLRIYGGGPWEGRLRNLIHRRHLYNHVFLMGTSRDLDRELAQASIYALSSRFEGFAMVVLEALNCGLPLVSFDCPTGPREVIRDGENGLLVPPEDPGAMAGALCRLIEDRRLRRRLGAAAIDTAAEYGPEAIRRRWEELFTELLAAKRAEGTVLPA